MFKIEYRIVISEFEDDIIGKKGFIRISINNHSYGDIYPEEIEQHMGVESIYYWLSYFMQAVIELETKDYVLISDIESYNTWLEIKHKNNTICSSIIHADKPQGTAAIEFAPVPNIKYTDWTAQEADFMQFKMEVIDNAKKYYNELCQLNPLNNEHRLIQTYLEQLNALTER